MKTATPNEEEQTHNLETIPWDIYLSSISLSLKEGYICYYINFLVEIVKASVK